MQQPSHSYHLSTKQWKMSGWDSVPIGMLRWSSLFPLQEHFSAETCGMHGGGLSNDPCIARSNPKFITTFIDKRARARHLPQHSFSTSTGNIISEMLHGAVEAHVECGGPGVFFCVEQYCELLEKLSYQKLYVKMRHSLHQTCGKVLESGL